MRFQTVLFLLVWHNALAQTNPASVRPVPDNEIYATIEGEINAIAYRHTDEDLRPIVQDIKQTLLQGRPSDLEWAKRRAGRIRNFRHKLIWSELLDIATALREKGSCERKRQWLDQYTAALRAYASKPNLQLPGVPYLFSAQLEAHELARGYLREFARRRNVSYLTCL